MTDHPLVHEQTPTEYFKELVESSLSRQHVRAGDLTEFYLVNLLCQYVRVDASPQPRRRRAAAGACAGCGRSRAAASSSACACAASGDLSLFMSGFFSDSFARRSVDVDYYRVPRRVRLRVAQSIGGRGVRRSLRRVVAQVRRLHGRPRRHQRPHDAGLGDRSDAHLREVAAHGQRARRPAARRAGHPAESVHRPPFHPVAPADAALRAAGRDAPAFRSPGAAFSRHLRGHP